MNSLTIEDVLALNLIVEGVEGGWGYSGIMRKCGEVFRPIFYPPPLKKGFLSQGKIYIM